MKIDHVALWVDDLESMRQFYLKYFRVTCGAMYTNPAKRYSSYFLSFDEGGARIELMHRPDISENKGVRNMISGLAHVCITVGSKQVVDDMTERFRADGVIVTSEPRTSGDGYYESAVLDPEGNYIELLAE